MSERDKFGLFSRQCLCCRLKTAEQEKRKTDMLLDEARKQTARLQVMNEERTNTVKRLQKRLLLVSYVSLYTHSSVIGHHHDICFCIFIIFLVLWCMTLFWAACSFLALSLQRRAIYRLFRGHIWIHKYCYSIICHTLCLLFSIRYCQVSSMGCVVMLVLLSFPVDPGSCWLMTSQCMQYCGKLRVPSHVVGCQFLERHRFLNIVTRCPEWKCIEEF
jgi:hypothetical protein